MAVSSKSKSNKLVRNPNTPSLKSQGAGYSTTNRKGETTFYKSSKDAPGYNDTTQSRSEMSKGTPISKFNSAGAVITADKLKPTEKIKLPTSPAVDGMFGVSDTINAGLAGSIGGSYDTTKKAIVPGQAEAPATPTTATSIFQNYMQSQLDGFNEQTTSESRLKEQQKMLRPKENLVNSLAGQVNTITANRDAQMLALEGQGRGQTGSFVGGEQARISREAAIQAMPIQAQLAIAQDDLESARSYASQLFQAQSQDAQNAYNFKKELNASIYNFLNDQEKTRVAQNEKALDRSFAVEQANRGTLKSLAMQAIEYGQGALSAEIMKLDPASSTFDADFGDVTSRLRKPVAASSVQTVSNVADNADLAAYANQYSSTGKLPTPAELKSAGLTVGAVTQYAKQAPKNSGALVNSNTGVSDSNLGTAEQEDLRRLFNITKMVDELEALDKERIGGVVAGTLGKVFGSDAQGSYLTKRKSIVDEIARMQTGAALTDEEQAFYNDYLPGRMSEPLFLGRDSADVIKNFKDEMKGKLDNALSNNQLSIYGYSKVDVNGTERTVGEVIDIGGMKLRVLPDGTLTDII